MLLFEEELDSYLQSLHNSGERLCMWHFPRILEVTIVSEGASDCRWVHSFAKKWEFFILTLIFYLQILHLYYYVLVTSCWDKYCRLAAIFCTGGPTWSILSILDPNAHRCSRKHRTTPLEDNARRMHTHAMIFSQCAFLVYNNFILVCW